MGFETFKEPSSGEGKTDVDFNGLNKHILEAYGSKEKRNMVGFVSSIVSLGMQDQEDGAMEFTGGAEAEQAELDAGRADRFDTVDGKRMKFWKQKPCAMVALTVDFPNIIVDKGQFFGNSDPRPLRMLLNGEWRFAKKDGTGMEMLVNSPYELKETTKALGTWSLNPKGILYRMGVAADLLNSDKSFKPENIDKLIGQCFQFETNISPYINGEKTYVNERIKFLGEPAEGVALPEVDPKYLSMVQFTTENTEEAVKSLRASVKNTIKRANNYVGSALELQLGASGGTQPSSQAGSPAPKVVDTPQANVTPDTPKEAPDAKVNFDDYDEDLPF